MTRRLQNPTHHHLASKSKSRNTLVSRLICKLIGQSTSLRAQHHHQKSHPTTLLTKSSVISTSTCCNHHCPRELNQSTWHSDESFAFISHRKPADSDLTVRLASQLSSKSSTQSSFSSLDDMPAPKLVDRRPDTVPVLTEDIAEQLRPYLPRRFRVAPVWTLLYSLDQHGTSLTTLYRRTRTNKGPCLLTIKDSDDQVFGAFLNETLKSSSSYYGTGECFLWKKDPHTGLCKAYQWTGKNEYMILAESDFIAVGGGEGKFGLWINSDLERGHSERCPTFDNEALSITSEFDCIQLEVWGFRI